VLPPRVDNDEGKVYGTRAVYTRGNTHTGKGWGRNGGEKKTQVDFLCFFFFWSSFLFPTPQRLVGRFFCTDSLYGKITWL